MSLPGAHPEVCTGVTFSSFFFLNVNTNSFFFFFKWRKENTELELTTCQPMWHHWSRKGEKKEQLRRKLLLNIQANQTSGPLKKITKSKKITYRFTLNVSSRKKKNVFPSLSGFLQNKKKKKEEKKYPRFPAGFLSVKNKVHFFSFLPSSSSSVNIFFLFFLLKKNYELTVHGFYPSHVTPLICGRRRALGMNTGRLKTSSQCSLPLLTGSLYHTLENLQTAADWPHLPNARVWTW